VKTAKGELPGLPRPDGSPRSTGDHRRRRTLAAPTYTPSTSPPSDAPSATTRQRTPSRFDIDSQGTGSVEASDDLTPAVCGAWMVIQAVPERLEVKRQVFGQLDQLCGPEVILASNSSSLPIRRLIDAVQHPERVRNTHDQMPPRGTRVPLDHLPAGQPWAPRSSLSP
jgi:hypothetical protein